MADMQGSKGGVRWNEADRDNREVYSGFLGLTKWAIAGIALVLIGMAIFLL
jgi:hypothetical protein